jgi:hypothetical protein
LPLNADLDRANDYPTSDISQNNGRPLGDRDERLLRRDEWCERRIGITLSELLSQYCDPQRVVLDE